MVYIHKMDIHSPPAEGTARSYEIAAPETQTIPAVYASPHSGTDYTAEFIAASQLDPLTLRKSEDSFVDELFGAVPRLGAPLLKALFPRAYVDPNREAFELDPTMFDGPLPDFTNTASPRVAAGLGTIARVVCTGAEIYRGRLNFGEAQRRIDTYYRPYHAALQRLIAGTRERFGLCLLIDCHSMPSVGGPMDLDPGRRRVDFVIGDCHGASCAPAIAERIKSVLEGFGYVVTRNMPYAGGFTTRHYGRPQERVHAIQIEINRALYMDENSYQRTRYFPTLVGHMTQLAKALGDLEWTAFAR
jgi:N-formylglutamate amidohydrolase